MAELLPCPRCNNIPEIQYSDDYLDIFHHRRFRYACPVCGIHSQPHENIHEAFLNWNDLAQNKKVYLL